MHWFWESAYVRSIRAAYTKLKNVRNNMQKGKLKTPRAHPYALATVEKDALVLEHGEHWWKLKSPADLEELLKSEDLEGVSFLCSSSTDFPDEKTDDPDVIATVNAFRNPEE